MIMRSVKWDWCRLTQLIQLCIGPTVSAGSHRHRQPEGNVHAGDRGAHTVETEQSRLFHLASDLPGFCGVGTGRGTAGWPGV